MFVYIVILISAVTLLLSAFQIDFAVSLYSYLFDDPVRRVLVGAALLGVLWEIYKATERVKKIEERVAGMIDNGNADSALDDATKGKVSKAIESAKGTSKNQHPLAHLVGLESVKKDIQQLSHFISTQEKRLVAGLPKQKISLHLVFTGNPGTGKTIMAREIAKIYRSYGLLEKGHLVETDRGDLVGEYVGHTAIKTKAKIKEALGGVLFIDEAYSLVDDKFGAEAIDTLLKEMEDKRDSFAVIVAGYREEMESFINSNPGLKSRFSRTIDFPDYSAAELLEIFELLCAKAGYIVLDDTRNSLAAWLVNSAPLGEKGFGNGRYIRNLYERTIVAQAERVSTQNLEDKESLQTISAEDISSAVRSM
ncbi:MAG: AAA family ATPase [Pseudohongiella sp.]|nr:AAA family ATPase [Pseudohongiella sp.]